MIDKNLFLFSNPFGYGPTSKLIVIAEEIKKKWPGEIFIAGNGLVEEIIDKNKFKFIKCDQRNIEEIENLLNKYNNAYVVSSLNRFAIKAAHNLNIPNVFIDGLTWMWDNIPDDYLLADIYFCTYFPGVEDKLKDKNNTKIIEYILADLPKKSITNNDFLIHLGGAENPIEEKLNENYFVALSKILHSLKYNNKILITGGSNALKFFSNLNNKYFIVKNYKKNEYLNILAKCKHLFTTSGLNGTYEAFKMQIPTSFILPLNLSQWRFENYLIDNRISDSNICWEDFFPEEAHKLNFLNEKDALGLIAILSKKLLEDDKLMEKYKIIFQKTTEDNPNTIKPTKFIKKIGYNGSVQLVEELSEKWDF